MTYSKSVPSTFKKNFCAFLVREISAFFALALLCINKVPEEIYLLEHELV